MDIFIDANILLSMYYLSSSDLDEMKKIICLIKDEKIKVHISEQVINEFYRCRQDVIQHSYKSLRNSMCKLTLPNSINIESHRKEFINLKDLELRFNQALIDLSEKIDDDISSNSLQADIIIQLLFESVSIKNITDKVLSRSIKRRNLGNPPGDNTKLGNQIHWEFLLETIETGKALYIISNDNDFGVCTVSGKYRPKEFLKNEWLVKKNQKLHWFRDLSKFLSRHFPDIEISDQLKMKSSIRRLVDARTFKIVKRAVKELKDYNNFEEFDIERMMDALINNPQINRIIEDFDNGEYMLLNFANKILELPNRKDSSLFLEFEKLITTINGKLGI